MRSLDLVHRLLVSMHRSVPVHRHSHPKSGIL